MPVVYLIAANGTDILALDHTEQVSIGRSNTLTSSSVMSGAQTSDGYTLGNRVISFNGRCTYSKVRRQGEGQITPPTPEELHQIFEDMENSQTRFTLYGNDLIPTVDNVVITNHRVMQTIYSNAVDVDITLEQAFISNQASLTEIILPTASAKEEVTGESTEETVTKEGLNSLEEFLYQSQLAGYSATGGF